MVGAGENPSFDTRFLRRLLYGHATVGQWLRVLTRFGNPYQKLSFPDFSPSNRN